MNCRLKLNRYFILFILFSTGLFFSACDRSVVFDDYTDIPNHQWPYDFQPEFQVEVEDTTIRYNLYINVRHSRFYGFRNLWVKVHTTFPDGDTLQRRVDLPLAESSGRWYGKCSGDICFTQVPIQYDAVFKEPGIYQFSIEQNMRQAELPYVMGIGVRLEKAGE